MCGCQKGQLGSPPQMPAPQNDAPSQETSPAVATRSYEQPPFFGDATSGASVFPVLNIQFGTPLRLVLR